MLFVVCRILIVVCCVLVSFALFVVRCVLICCLKLAMLICCMLFVIRCIFIVDFCVCSFIAVHGPRFDVCCVLFVRCCYGYFVGCLLLLV